MGVVDIGWTVERVPESDSKEWEGKARGCGWECGGERVDGWGWAGGRADR